MPRLVTAALALAATAVASLTLATPASASTTISASWRPYGNTNPITSSSSHWFCGSTKTVDTDIAAQVCLVRSADYSAFQSAVIVRNNRSTGVTMVGIGDIYKASTGVEQYTSTCAASTVGATSWSVCFSATKAGPYTAYATGYAATRSVSQYLGASPSH